jgi:hypothetical protein
LQTGATREHAHRPNAGATPNFFTGHEPVLYDLVRALLYGNKPYVFVVRREAPVFGR